MRPEVIWCEKNEGWKVDDTVPRKIDLYRIELRMDNEGIDANSKYIPTADPVGMERTSCLYTTVYWNIVYWRDFLPTPTDQLYVCICLNSLVVYSTSYSI